MKNFKLVFIISIVYLCTACSIEYNIKLDEYSYSENLYVTESFDNYNDKGWSIDKAFRYNQQMIDMEIDQPTQIEYFLLSSYYNLFGIGAHLSNSSRSFEDYILPIHRCYESYTLVNGENEITLETSGEFLCSDFLQTTDDITVNIYSDYKLIETNANKVDNGKYTWHLKQNDDKNLILKLSTVVEKTVVEKVSHFNWKVLSIIAISIIIVIFIVLCYVGYVNKKANKI